MPSRGLTTTTMTLGLLFLCSLPGALSCSPYLGFQNLYIFGASVSDTGNAAYFYTGKSTVGNYYLQDRLGPLSRWSDGKVWADTFKDDFGFKAVDVYDTYPFVPEQSGRSRVFNFAIGGAQINGNTLNSEYTSNLQPVDGTSIAGDDTVHGYNWQLQQFLRRATKGQSIKIPDTLLRNSHFMVVNLGANDFRDIIAVYLYNLASSCGGIDISDVDKTNQVLDFIASPVVPLHGTATELGTEMFLFVHKMFLAGVRDASVFHVDESIADLPEVTIGITGVLNSLVSIGVLEPETSRAIFEHIHAQLVALAKKVTQEFKDCMKNHDQEYEMPGMTVEVISASSLLAAASEVKTFRQYNDAVEYDKYYPLTNSPYTYLPYNATVETYPFPYQKEFPSSEVLGTCFFWDTLHPTQYAADAIASVLTSPNGTVSPALVRFLEGNRKTPGDDVPTPGS